MTGPVPDPTTAVASDGRADGRADGPAGAPVRIVVLSGGVGGARFVQGLRHALTRGALPAAEVTVVANTADDWWLHGLKVCPDLDTLMYTLGGGIDAERGWGRADETWHAKEELAAYDVEPTWFGLGDRDLATHLVRTQMLDAGYSLTQVTEALCRRWQPGVRLLPMSDDRVETHLAIADPQSPSGIRVVHFQEYWVRLHAEPEVREILLVGADRARVAPAAAEALAAAEVVILAPSNPVVSVGTILATAGVREALASAGRIVGLSPIIGGAAVRGMAEPLLAHLGVPVSAAGVAAHYGARADGGILDAWLVDEADEGEVATIRAGGIAASAGPLRMTSLEATARMAMAAFQGGFGPGEH